jgi:hypothetical protein
LPAGEIQEGVERLGRERYKILLGIMLLLLGVGPFFTRTYLTHIVFSSLLLYGVYAIRPRKGFLYFCISFVFTDITLSWIGVAIQSRLLESIGLVMDFTFMSILAALILRRVLRSSRVTGETIAGGICVYLLIGVLWSTVFGVIDRVIPGSFPEKLAAASQDVRAHGSTTEYLYFSFVTLTTLGYGDIAPLKQPAKMLAALEAIMGQLYIAILIAWLVASYTSTRRMEHVGTHKDD